MATLCASPDPAKWWIIDKNCFLYHLLANSKITDHMYACVNENYVLPLIKVTVSEHSLFVITITTIYGSHGPEDQLAN